MGYRPSVRPEMKERSIPCDGCGAIVISARRGILRRWCSDCAKKRHAYAERAYYKRNRHAIAEKRMERILREANRAAALTEATRRLQQIAFEDCDRRDVALDALHALGFLEMGATDSAGAPPERAA